MHQETNFVTNDHTFRAEIPVGNFLNTKFFHRGDIREVIDSVSRSIALVADWCDFEPIYQRHDRGCVSATLSSLAHFLNYGSDLSYDEVRVGLMHDRYYDKSEGGFSNDGELIHCNTVLHYFNHVLTPEERGDFQLELRTGSTLDDIIDAIKETGRPVLVGYMLPVVPSALATTYNLLFSIPKIGEFLSQKLNSNDRFVVPSYLHAGAILGVCKNQHGERQVIISDSWHGKAIACSRPSPLIDLIPEQGFLSRWLKFENPSIHLPHVKSWWENDYGKRMNRLYQSGTFLVVKESTPPVQPLKPRPSAEHP